jgi:acetyl esterase/lipase
MRRFLFTTIFLVTMVAAQDGDVSITKNIAYVEGDNADPRHMLDIYAPEGVEDFPVLMYVSGGGWTSGSKDWIAPLGMTFAARGIGVVTVDHRLAPDVTTAQQAEDLARAFEWITQHIAEYGGDPTRIVVGGHSAGGHLTSLMVMDAQYLEAVGHSLDDITGVLPMSGVLDAGGDFSPLQHLQRDLPPFLLLVAEGDSSGVIAVAGRFEEELTALDVPARREIIAERDHFSIMRRIGEPEDETARLMFEWMTELFAEGNADE